MAVFVFLMFVPVMLFAQRESCRDFVQSFYQWYVPYARSAEVKEPAWNIALSQKRSSFSTKLYRLLKEDSEAQSKASEIVGLDFDPFLNSQDPSERFVVENTTASAGLCRAFVRGIDQGTKQEKVTAEAVFSDGHWIFTNFHYEKLDLISVLKKLRDDRNKP